MTTSVKPDGQEIRRLRLERGWPMLALGQKIRESINKQRRQEGKEPRDFGDDSCRIMVTRLEHGDPIHPETLAAAERVFQRAPDSLRAAKESQEAVRLLDVAHRAYVGLRFLRDLTEILISMRIATGWDRMRLYIRSRAQVFEGLVELGGAMHFRKVRITPADLLSLVLLKHRGQILWTRQAGTPYVRGEWSPGKHSAESRKALDYLDLTAHDLPSIQRDAELKRWVDAAIEVHGEVVAKLTCDCMYAERRGTTPEKRLSPSEPELETAIERLEEHFGTFMRGEFSVGQPVTGLSDEAKKQAYRYTVLSDQVRTAMLSLLNDRLFNGAFDRIRFYMDGAVYTKLFGRFCKSIHWNNHPIPGTACLVGFAELGGVRAQFEDVLLLPVGQVYDECTAVFFGKSNQPRTADFKRAHRLLRQGLPVVFCDDRRTDFTRFPARFRATFYKPEAVDREGVHEHIDIACPSLQQNADSTSLGKLTIDAKWHANGRLPPALTPIQVGRLKRYAREIGALIDAAEHLPHEDLHEVPDYSMRELQALLF